MLPTIRRVALLLLIVVGTGYADPTVSWSGEQNIVLGDPEINPSPRTWWLDVDNDGVDDFFFDYFNNFRIDLSIEPAGDNRTVAEDDGFSPLLDSAPLPAGADVGPTVSSPYVWNPDDMFMVEWATLDGGEHHAGGPWAGVNNGYMGIEFTAADGTHYGWVRISASDETPTATIHDWAYETVPGQSIITGVVPEPSTLLLFAIGSGVIAALRWLHRR